MIYHLYTYRAGSSSNLFMVIKIPELVAGWFLYWHWGKLQLLWGTWIIWTAAGNAILFIARHVSDYAYHSFPSSLFTNYKMTWSLFPKASVTSKCSFLVRIWTRKTVLIMVFFSEKWNCQECKSPDSGEFYHRVCEWELNICTYYFRRRVNNLVWDRCQKFKR